MRIRLESRPHANNPVAIKEASAIDKELFPLDRRAKYKESYLLIARDGGKAIGFACVRFYEKPGEVYGMFTRVGVLPKYEGKGLHKRFIKRRLDVCRKVGVKRVISYTTLDNFVSANNLIKCGFRIYWPDPPWASSKSVYWVKKL